MFYSFPADQLRQWMVDQAYLATYADEAEIAAMHLELLAFYDEQLERLEELDPEQVMRWDAALAASRFDGRL